jgi:putative oxidoreductase
MQLERCKHWIHSHREFLVELVRIYLGAALFIRGVFFLLNPEMLRVPDGNAWLTGISAIVPYVHMVGGLLLALGILARTAALVQMPILFVATFFVNLPQMRGMEGREAIEFSALVLFLLAIFAVRGAGSLSLARRMKRGAPAPLWEGEYQRWINLHPDLFMDFIRAYLGLGLFIKGVYILNNQSEFMRVVENSPGDMPLGLMTIAHYVIPAHFAGGAMLLFGVCTRLAALSQIPLLIGAVLYVYLPRFATLELRQNLEFSALVLFLLTVILVHGPGRYSVDYLARKKEEQEAMHLEPAHSV